MFKNDKDYKIHKEKVQKSENQEKILSNQLFKELNNICLICMTDGLTDFPDFPLMNNNRYL